MIERKCINCGKMFGQSLDDGASGDDTTIGLCEICRAESPGGVLAVDPSVIIPNPQTTLPTMIQVQGETSDCPQQAENVEPQADNAFLTQYRASERPESRKDPAICRTGLTFSIVGRKTIADERFSGAVFGESGQKEQRIYLYRWTTGK